MKYMGFMNSSYRGRKHEGTCGMPDYVKLNAWDVGVRLEPANTSQASTPAIRVYLTGGSHDAGGKTEIGTAVQTDTGPRWVPAGLPAVAPVVAGGLPVVAAIPVGAHRNEPRPAGYVCVVISGRWPSGEPRFGIAHLAREDGEWIVTSHSDYWDSPMSLTEAVTAMVELTGHSRPACTKPHAAPGKAASTDAGSSRGTDADVLSEISDALQDACADPEDTLARIERALSRES